DSVGARLQLAFAGARKRGDHHAGGVFERDLRGQPRLAAATPPLRRASMAPHPWSTNPVMRRRVLVFGLAIAQTVAATCRVRAMLPDHGGNPAEIAYLVVLAILCGLLSIGLWTVLLRLLFGAPQTDAVPARARSTRWRWVGLWRRALLFGLAIAQTIVATY